MILNRRLGVDIALHSTLHRFQYGRVIRTATFEAKLLKHMMDMRGLVLYNILLDLHKAHDALDRDVYLKII